LEYNVLVSTPEKSMPTRILALAPLLGLLTGAVALDPRGEV